MDSRRAGGALLQDLGSLVVEQWRVAGQGERLGLAGCFGGGDGIELRLRLGLSGGYGCRGAGDEVQVGWSADFDEPAEGVARDRGRRTALESLGGALDERRRVVEPTGVD